MRTLIFLSLLISSYAFAESHLLFMGGGGEPSEKDTTIFDDDIPKVGKFKKKKKDWKFDLSFNGGHAKTESLIANQLEDQKIKNASFTQGSFLEKLKKYEQQIMSGEIKTGDQLMVVIDTHGATAMGGSHQIATNGGDITNLNSLSGGKLASMDNILDLMTAARKKGVKLAIIDLSCHSGNTLKLDDGHACMISASGTHHYSYAGPGTFSSHFFKQISSKDNLEEAFLTARRKTGDLSFPMISSPSGIETQKGMYESITPYLFVTDKNKINDKLRQYLFTVADCVNCESSVLPNVRLAADISKMKNISVEALLKMKEYKELEKAMISYYGLQQRVATQLDGRVNLLKEGHRICDVGLPTVGLRYLNCAYITNEELLLTDYEASIAAMETALKDEAFKKSPKGVAVQSELQILKNARDEKKKLIAGKPELSTYKDYMAGILDPRSSRMQAYKVNGAARKLYEKLYEMESNVDQPNPCRDFKL